MYGWTRQEVSNEHRSFGCSCLCAMGESCCEEAKVNVVALAAAFAALWLAQAVGLSRVMARRGFHPLPWFAVSAILGPAIWPLALLDAVSGPPAPQLLRRGMPGTGALEVFVAFERDEVPDEIVAQVKRLLPFCGRVVLARVVKAEGPSYFEAAAERFLSAAADQLRARDAELKIFFGHFDAVLRDIQDQHHFNFVLRSDKPDELFERDVSREETRCLLDAPAA